MNIHEHNVEGGSSQKVHLAYMYRIILLFLGDSIVDNFSMTQSEMPVT